MDPETYQPQDQNETWTGDVRPTPPPSRIDYRTMFPYQYPKETTHV